MAIMAGRVVTDVVTVIIRSAIQELPKLPFICTKYHLDTIYRSKDMIILVVCGNIAISWCGVRNRRSRTRTDARTGILGRTYCGCAVRWVVTDKDIILIANFGGSITENRRIPQLGSFYCHFLRI